MKDNAIIVPYIPIFELGLRKWPYPAYQILKLFLFLSLMGMAIADSSKLGEWRLAEDSMEFTDDKQLHLVGSFCLYNLMVHHNVSPRKSAAITMGVGVLKEYYDAYVPWEKYGVLGGDGFSRHDIAYNSIGLVSGYITDKLFRHYIISFFPYKGKNIEIYIIYNI